MSEKQGGNFSLETYIVKQETFLIENIRKVLQGETKIVLLESALQEMYKSNESLNEQVQVQNQTIQQSLAGLQATTSERDRAQNRLKDLERAYEECDNERVSLRVRSNENANKVAVLEDEMRQLNSKLDVVVNDYATLRENYARVLAALEEAQQKIPSTEVKAEPVEVEFEAPVVASPAKKKRSNKEKAQSTDSEWTDGQY